MTPAQAFLAMGMLITGSINTISTKLADQQCVPDLKAANPPETCYFNVSATSPTPTNTTGDGCMPGCEVFDHPFTQASGMFLGELMCIFAFRVVLLMKRNDEDDDDDLDLSEEFKEEKFSPVIFALPAFCDMIGTCIMYLGLTMTYASVFQMLRGSVVVFTGLLSILVLGKRLHGSNWLGMVLVTAGAFVVGLSSVVGKSDDKGPAPSNPVLGNILIVSAQVVVATQMVVEERFLSKYKIHALQAVGWEGFWGLIFLCCWLVGMYYVPRGMDVCDGHPCVENPIEALKQIATSHMLMLAVAGNVISIAFFNWFGISVTKSMSATHRMVLDSLRTMVIWAFSLAVGWQSFHILQVVGFVVLLMGTLVYNEIVVIPGVGLSPNAKRELVVNEDERDGLLG
mmetsp:Transcript_27520/g.67949  ORF Transcript_27520/g.67949 Transcript_27520/m.67949 type:complete len:398 (+) Transcript_27520:192-1385(+)|eukprot:CAMPEP_0206255360 /NCGR_PEP_ID=MMETSP0047_2-20121206/24202_1 /ASSEMBLY_ACC=CAM_ASM_000192 /TAXON_ID=195065 /ORGANISM="Chroomonas mesostigmatica_cf, Strain CCMP1168" /LENGTH=397 /DNA_ID=CAMNT_0053681747 /DNA_START=133 /DNA_END=1326 /DNA_ORIENTATION=-